LDCIEAAFAENSHVTVPHPPNSPGLALSDFWRFGHRKTSLTGCVFNVVDELLEVIIEFLNEIQPSELQLVFHQWIERAKWVEPSVETTITIEQHVLHSRGKVLPGRRQPLLMNYTIIPHLTNNRRQKLRFLNSFCGKEQ
jgi:hypothetical protein